MVEGEKCWVGGGAKGVVFKISLGIGKWKEFVRWLTGGGRLVGMR